MKHHAIDHRPEAREPVQLSVAEIISFTPKQICVRLHNGWKHFFPRSCIAEADTLHVGDRNVTITLPRWLLHNHGIG